MLVTRFHSIVFPLVLLVFSTLSASKLHAQASDGNVVGLVTDSTGAVLPNVTVDLLNIERV